MQKLFLVLAACAALITAPAEAVVLVDRIVAVVNKDVVTSSELNEAVGMAERQLRRQGQRHPPADDQGAAAGARGRDRGPGPRQGSGFFPRAAKAPPRRGPRVQ